MAPTLLAHRFQLHASIDERESVSLAIARDVSAEEDGWLLRLAGKDFVGLETAVRARLRLFGRIPLFPLASPRAVAEADQTLHFLFHAHGGEDWPTWLGRVEKADQIGEAIHAIAKGLDAVRAAAHPAGALGVQRLWVREGVPFFLPTAVAAPVDAQAIHARDLRRTLEEHRRFLGELCVSLDAWAEGRGPAARESVDRWREELRAEDDPAHSSIEDLAAEVGASGGLILLEGNGRLERPLRLDSSAYTVIHLRPFVRAPVARRAGGAPPAVIVFEDVRAFAPFAESLDQLDRQGWLDGHETLVLCTRGPVVDEPLRLFIRARRNRSNARTEERRREAARSDPPASPLVGVDRRLIETLAVADRPLSDRVLGSALSLDPEALAERAAELCLRGRLEMLVGRHGETGSPRVLVLDLPPGASVQVEASRRSELEWLLASALESLEVRGGLGRAWLRAEAATLHDVERALPHWRAVVRRAEKDGLDLLAYAAYDRMLGHEAVLPLRLEDHCRAAICMGEQHQLQGEVETSDRILTRALEVLESSSAGQAERIAPLACDLVLKLVQLDLHRSRFQSAESRLTDLLEHHKNHLPAIQRARIYLDLSWAQLQQGRTRECMSYCELTLRILDVERHPAIVARAYNQLGFAQYKESDYARSIVNYQRSLVLRQQLGDELAVARSFNNLALSHRALGQLREAERCLQESLGLKRRVSDNLGVAASLLNLGFVYLDQGRFPEARARAEECLDIARELHRLETEAEAYGLLGEVAMGEGRIAEARELLERDLAICEATGHQSERLATLRRLVSVLLAAGEIDEAAQALEQARELLSEQSSRYEGAMLERLEAELLALSGAREPAIEAFAAAARVFSTLQRHGTQLRCLARKGTLEAELEWTRAARATLAEIQDLIGRHELHRVPEEVRALEARLGSREEPFTATSPERCLATLANVVGAGGEVEEGRPESALRMLLSLLGGEELLWLSDRERVILHLLPTGFGRGGVPRELSEALSDAVPTAGPPRWHRGSWHAARVGGTEGGWLALSRQNSLEVHESDLLRAAAGILGIVRAPAPRGSGRVGTPLETGTAGETNHGMVGSSEALRQVLRTVEMVRDNDVTVLLLGENGTGKDLVARAIHRTGRRRAAPFVAINCASIPPTLLESELFGHEKGAFTSAHDRRAGVFERANGGTIFLDEIGEMPLAMQAKLLRVLQDHRFTRVGGSETLSADVRVIAATNRDLLEEVRQGRFRMDLYYRLNVVTLELPPLRERVADIEPLVEHFLRRHAEEFGSTVRGVAREAMARLEEYDWPGNVRELENVIKSALVFADDDLLRLEDLPPSILEGSGQAAGQSVEDAVRSIVASQDWSEERPLMPRVELLLVHEAVEAIGNKTKAARLLGITKPTLYNRLRRFHALYGKTSEEDPR